MAKSEINYDESTVVVENLPNLLAFSNGTHLTTVSQWQEMRRPEIIDVLSEQIFGRTPFIDLSPEYEIISSDSNYLDGAATREEIKIYPCGKNSRISIQLLLLTPNRIEGKVPTFVAANFKGNEEAEADLQRWPFEKIISAGFALATFHYWDIEIDNPQGWKNGIRGEHSRDEITDDFRDDDWGAIAAWAWGLSRALDYVIDLPEIDADKVAVIGHSRLGKAALWAAALDQRFALVVSNNSGTGGAKLLRRNFGESIESITQEFPHWFAKNFASHSDHVCDLPIDAHSLLSLVAPRPLYVASASEDLWADPRGEFIASKHASQIYELHGYRGIDLDTEWPPVNSPVGDRIRYHVRSGSHGITPYDWDCYLDFARQHLGGD